MMYQQLTFAKIMNLLFVTDRNNYEKSGKRVRILNSPNSLIVKKRTLIDLQMLKFYQD